MGSLLPGWESGMEAPKDPQQSIPIQSVPWWLQEPTKLNLIRQSPGLMRSVSGQTPDSAGSVSPPKKSSMPKAGAFSPPPKPSPVMRASSDAAAVTLGFKAQSPAAHSLTAERPPLLRRPSLSRDAEGHLKMLVTDKLGHSYDATIEETKPKPSERAGWWARMDSGCLNETAADAATGEAAASGFRCGSYQPQTNITGQTSGLTSAFKQQALM